MRMKMAWGTFKKITSQSAKPIFHHTASADCPNRPAMRSICFLVWWKIIMAFLTCYFLSCP
jgi:hypothetical protein